MQSEPAVSPTIPDWSREYKRTWDWAPARSLLAAFRAYDKWSESSLPWSMPMRKFATLRHRFWSVVTGTDIPLGTLIQGGLLLPHANGVVIHPHSVIGPNCLIFQQVTLAAGKDGAPILEGHVDIGAGAKLLGGIRIGAHARVGANAVVTIDVPSGCVAVGVPARIVRPPHHNDA